MSHAHHLFRVVLTLKQVAREHEVYIHCFHISGDRMIASGVDGLSRGNYDSGISLGFDVVSFCHCPKRVGCFGSSTRFQMRKVVGK
jgi:hypothetical protein